MIDSKSCSCDKCKQSCWYSNGWFGSIEEIKGAANLKGMKLKEFIKKYLIQEWWAGDNEEVSILAPRKDFIRSKDRPTTNATLNKIYEEQIGLNGRGFVRATWGHNLMIGYPCIFLDDNNMCTIHASKPTECRDSCSCDPIHDGGIRKKMVEYWKKHQDFIKKYE